MWRSLNTWGQQFSVRGGGGCGREVKQRVQVRWNSRSDLGQAGISKSKREGLQNVTPAMLYRLETVTSMKRQEAELEMAESKML